MAGLGKYQYDPKGKRRQRIRNHLAKDLRKPEYRQRVVEDKKKKPVDVKKLTHRELVELINEKKDEDDN